MKDSKVPKTDFSHRKDDLLSEVRDGILVLAINRQKNYNSWTSALRDELAALERRLQSAKVSATA